MSVIYAILLKILGTGTQMPLHGRSQRSKWRIPPRRGAGVVERGGLENRCPFTGTQGSNPCLSATHHFHSVLLIASQPLMGLFCWFIYIPSCFSMIFDWILFYSLHGRIRGIFMTALSGKLTKIWSEPSAMVAMATAAVCTLSSIHPAQDAGLYVSP